ncbi:Peroxisomal membrane protein pex16, partial [Boothiomyces sp. JEL0866]
MNYENFILKNAQHVQSVEASLRTLSYFLPGRFDNSEILSEALYSGTKLVGLYHDSILEVEAQKQQPKGASAFNRYNKGLLRKARIICWVLTVIRSFETTAEMISSRVSKIFQEKFVLMIEIVKAALRLALFKISGNRMIMHSVLPERDYDLAKLEPGVEAGSWKAARTKKEHLSVDALTKDNADFNPAMQYLLSKAMIEPSLDPLDLLPRLSGFKEITEYVYIFRPLIYVLCIRKWGAQSFKPWVISILLELFSFTSRFDFETRHWSKDLTQLEKSEMKHRVFLLRYYLLRNPIYEIFSKPKIQGIIDWTITKPLLSIIGSVLNDYTPLWENYHFYTS